VNRKKRPRQRPLYRDADRERIVAEEALSLHAGAYRSEFRRDYARLVHSPAVRRLQGKTQLFPSFESDFFRNRLTHCIEVAQVAKSIALSLNATVTELARSPIDLDLVEFAGLAHDLGHPPFGHNGERALDERMKGVGGFEGNAQTLRIVTKLEKKRLHENAPGHAKDVGIGVDGIDYRAGLNPTARSIAAVLKYDHPIDVIRNDSEPLAKGYYRSETDVVAFVKEKVLDGGALSTPFKTLECQIMDLADDIAYSTYDLEDTLKAGFLTPLDFLALPAEFRERVAEQVRKTVGPNFTSDDVRDEIIEIFEELVRDDTGRKTPLAKAVEVYRRSEQVASTGYARTELTAALVGEFIDGIKFEYDARHPVLSKVRLRDATLRRVETLKHLNYQATILSPRLKVAEYRGFEIVQTIFDALSENGGDALLPDDFQKQYRRSASHEAQKRVICDFIAGMTDAYAIEFYARLRSENPRTIFKPL
jgi:dGTPase